MRSIGLIILLAAIFTLAGEAPPAPLSMNIFMHDGTVESIPCSRLDQTDGITFENNGMKMIVNLSDPNPMDPFGADPFYYPRIKSTRFFVTSLIDCITFTVIAPPAE